MKLYMKNGKIYSNISIIYLIYINHLNFKLESKTLYFIIYEPIINVIIFIIGSYIIK